MATSPTCLRCFRFGPESCTRHASLVQFARRFRALAPFQDEILQGIDTANASGFRDALREQIRRAFALPPDVVALLNRAGGR